MRLPDRLRPDPALGLLAPALLALAVFFLYPAISLIWRSFTEPSLGLAQYGDLLGDGVTLGVLARTLWVSALVSVVTLIIAYPYAYLMTTTGPRVRAVLVALALLPFWLSLMARTFAWVVLLQRGGPISWLLEQFGLHDVTLVGTLPGVVIGMVQVLLPFMVLPLYSTMQGIDRRLVTAARSLGAGPATTFRTVVLPLSMPGVVAGLSLVFVVALGFYVTPVLLGSPQNALIAQLIGIKVEQLRDFPAAGAMAVLMLVATAVVLAAATRMVRLGDMFGGAR
ncbi:ABC transporter permease [Microtetraspora sp. NBRC 16547]|uniref:ABC transporter permease n=1 Tax=Microtetraspora sp. NBRC 16547 TaxID=3030993 RepID=UPI0025537DD4|nr:ABC transporter permease [Microtetraspora sp. NBRC 16547]